MTDIQTIIFQPLNPVTLSWLFYSVAVLYDRIFDLRDYAGGWYSWLCISREGAHHNGARNAEYYKDICNKQGCEEGMG
jgi:hypothetical protein